MATDLVLLTRTAPTTADLRAACDEPWLETVGDLDAGDPLVEVSTTGGALLLQVFRPRRVPGEQVSAYAEELGMPAPLDSDGCCAITTMAVASSADPAALEVVLGVCAALVLATGGGHLVVDGAVVPLDGRPAPEVATPTAPSAPPPEPPAQVFAAAYLGEGAGDADGWRRLLGRVRTLLEREPSLRPREIETETGWAAFRPTDPEPEWWPTDQALLTREPFTRWSITGAASPGDRCSTLALATAAGPETGAGLVDGLLRLPALDYGLVHAWHDAETAADLGSDPAGLREDHGRRRLLLTPRDLAVRLPTLFWAQVLGPPWVDLFGVETIASTPAHRVEELPGGGWLVQLSEHLSDVADDHDRFADVRRACIAHLGADCFYSPEQGPGGSYRAAVVPTLAERG